MENITNPRQRAIFESGRPGTIPSWKESLANAVRDPAELIGLLGLEDELLAEGRRALPARRSKGVYRQDAAW